MLTQEKVLLVAMIKYFEPDYRYLGESEETLMDIVQYYTQRLEMITLLDKSLGKDSVMH